MTTKNGHISTAVLANAMLLGRVKDAHSIHFPGATGRTRRISTLTATSSNAILILCIAQGLLDGMFNSMLQKRKLSLEVNF